MKAYRGIVWYLFGLYATTIWVNHHHFAWLPNKKSNDKLSSSVSIDQPFQFVRCLLLSESEGKVETKECKTLMQNLRKQMSKIVETAASNPSVSLAFASILLPEITSKNGKTVKYSAVASESKATLIAASIQQLAHKINGKEHDHLIRLFGIVALTLAVFVAFILAPISSTHQYIYLVTVAIFLLFAFFFLICLIRSFVHYSIRFLSLNRYHFWLFPNLTEDVGLLKSFYPIVQYRRNRSQSQVMDFDQVVYSEQFHKSTQSNEESNVFEDVPLDSSDLDDQEEPGQMISEDEQQFDQSNKDKERDLFEEQQSKSTLTQSMSERMFKSLDHSIVIPTKDLTHTARSMHMSCQQLSPSIESQKSQEESRSIQETQLRKRHPNSKNKLLEASLALRKPLNFMQIQQQALAKTWSSFSFTSSSSSSSSLLNKSLIDRQTDDVNEKTLDDHVDGSSDEFEFLSENDIPNKV